MILIAIDLISAFVLFFVIQIAAYFPWSMLYAWSNAAAFFLTACFCIFFFLVSIGALMGWTRVKTTSVPVKIFSALFFLGLSVLFFQPVLVFARDMFGFGSVSRVAVIEKVQKNHKGYRSSCTYSVYLQGSEDPISATCGMIYATFGKAASSGKTYKITYLSHSNLLLSADMQTQ